MFTICINDCRLTMKWYSRTEQPSVEVEFSVATCSRSKVKSRLREDPLPCPQDQVKLDSCFVGKKHCLDVIPISDVISMFGPYIKFFVLFPDPDVDPAPRAPVCNAFDVLMLAQRSLSAPVVPSRIPVCTKKDDLYNALIDLLQQQNLKLPGDDTNGKRLLKALMNALCYM